MSVGSCRHTHAIRINETGGPEVLRWEEVDVGEPGVGEVRIHHTAVGLNFIDVYHRTGLYPLTGLPATLGMEAAGVIESVGGGVTELRVGDRVAYAGLPVGAYCEHRVLSAHGLVPLPEFIDDRQAAAMMLQGMTAQYLLRRCYRVEPGETILIHAAAGGVGTIACQWAKQLGARVIGTVGSDEKAEIARLHGCDYPINYRAEDLVARVRALTDGEGVAVVYDSVGRDTFERSLDCLQPMGMLVSFGQSSGPIPPVDLSILAVKGSIYLTRPSLMTYTAKRDDLLASARELFDVVARGAVRVEIRQTYSLSETAQAHRDLEARETTGSTVLLP